MNEEMEKVFEKRVQFLYHHVPRDDIYVFAQQALTAASLFLYKWGELVDLDKEAAKNPRLGQWVKLVCEMVTAQQNGVNGESETDE